MRYLVILGLLVSLAWAAPASAQTGGWTLPLASFTGTVRGVDKKTLLLEEADTNTLQFFCSGKTRYYEGQKKIRAAGIKPGDRVSVDASRGPDGKLDAVNVRLLRPEDARSPR